MKLLRAAAAAIVLLLLQAPAYAQAERTWVSGTGDDAFPCSRTQPCKTFAGAIGKTADGGVISVLDPGGYGGFVIAKSIAIQGDQATSSILSSGANAITINAPNAFVHLRGLFIQGDDFSQVNGIKIVAAAAVTIEQCTIRRFAANAISVETTAPVNVFVSHCTLDKNGSAIRVQATAPTPVKVFVSDSTISNNGDAITATTSNNEVYLDRLRIVHNRTGILSLNNHTIFHLNASVVTGNSIGIGRVDGRIVSSRNNAIGGNIQNGQALGPEPLK